MIIASKDSDIIDREDKNETYLRNHKKEINDNVKMNDMRDTDKNLKLQEL